MARPPLKPPIPRKSADGRPRLYCRQLVDGGFTARKGVNGLDNGRHPSPGAAINQAIEAIDRQPAVIFWEGMTDGED